MKCKSFRNSLLIIWSIKKSSNNRLTKHWIRSKHMDWLNRLMERGKMARRKQTRISRMRWKRNQVRPKQILRRLSNSSKLLTSNSISLPFWSQSYSSFIKCKASSKWSGPILIWVNFLESFSRTSFEKAMKKTCCLRKSQKDPWIWWSLIEWLKS